MANDKLGYFALIEILRARFPDKSDLFGAMWADIHDMNEISSSFVKKMQTNITRSDDDALQNALIELEIDYLDHMSFHINSLKKIVEVILDDL